jgi:hypothetical protein
MANILKDSVHIYVRDLISEGFKPNNNKEKSFSCNRKSTVDENGNEHSRSARKCSLKLECPEARE